MTMGYGVLVLAFSQLTLTHLRELMIENLCFRFWFLRLIGLKNIFGRQLPNMPKEYIVRLLMDRYQDGKIGSHTLLINFNWETSL